MHRRGGLGLAAGPQAGVGLRRQHEPGGDQAVQTMVIDPLRESGALAGGYRIEMGGTADKLRATWEALWFNLVIAGLITYLLMAALFESWFYPAVIIAAVPLGSIGGLLGLAALNTIGGPFGIFQSLDVLTMLGFVILIGTVVNNPILIVDRSLRLVRDEGEEPVPAILDAVRRRIRPTLKRAAGFLLETSTARAPRTRGMTEATGHQRRRRTNPSPADRHPAASMPMVAGSGTATE